MTQISDLHQLCGHDLPKDKQFLAALCPPPESILILVFCISLTVESGRNEGAVPTVFPAAATMAQPTQAEEGLANLEVGSKTYDIESEAIMTAAGCRGNIEAKLRPKIEAETRERIEAKLTGKFTETIKKDIKEGLR